MIIDKFPKTSTAPTFSIDSPGNYTLFGKLAPNYSLTITEVAGNFTWYEFLEIGVNSTPIELEGTLNENIEAEFNQTMWNSLSNGTATVRFYVNNSLGELGYLDAIIRIDILDPVINIISPTGGFFNSTPPDYTIEISDPNLNKTWYTLNTNQTKHIFTSNGTIDGWSYLNDGIVTITFYANDSVSNENSTSVQVTKDIVDPGAPSFLTSDPSSWTKIDSFNLSWTNPADISGITGAYYKLDSVPSTDTNGTYIAGSDIESIIGISVTTDGNHTIYVWLNDTAGNIDHTNYSTTQLYLDTTCPLIIDSQSGDDIWLNTAGTTYDVDFNDSSPSSNLDYAQYIITNETGQGGTILKDWTNIFTNLEATSYINNWTIDFDFCQEGFNYISVRVYDEAGNNETLDDVFYVKKDTTNPLISDLQDGDDTWRNTAGTTYNVDFTDSSPSSNLDYAQYKITSETGQGGTVLKDWTNIFTNLGTTSYTTDWSIDFAACKEGINYISVRVYDEVGNFQVVNDVFYVKKDTINPILVLNTPVNNTCWNTPPPINITVYEPNFAPFSFTYTVFGYGPEILVNNTEELLNQDIWDDLSEGVFQIIFKSFDILGQSSNLTITLYKDTFAPSLGINLPVNNTYWNSRPYLNITAFDPNLDTIWYSVNNVNITLSNNTLQELNMSIWDGLPDEGAFEIQIYANDTFGHLNDNYILTLYKDVVAPTLIINSPLNNTFWNSIPFLNITAFDPNLDTLWYSVNNVNITLSNNTLQELNSSIWDNLPDEGDFTIYFYANDSVGNLNDLFRLDLNKDIRNPVLTIINPNPNDLFGDIAPDFEISISELNLNQTWYMLYNQTWNSLNYSFNELTGKINQVAWEEFWNLTVTTVTIRFYANDTLNHLGFIEVTVRKNLFVPIITIVSPENNDLFGIEAPNITRIYKAGTELNTTWYTIDNGVTNYTFSGSSVVINQTAWDNYGFGNVIITFYINDSLGKIGSDTITIRKDPDSPEITIFFINPSTNNTYWDIEPTFRVSVYEPNNHSIWYRVGMTNVFISNNTDITLQSTIWNNLPQGIFIIEIFANDTLGYINDPITLTFYKDTLAPSLVINEPYDGNYYNSPPPINITVYDPNHLSLTYTVVGHTPDTFPLVNNTEDLLNGTIWNSLSQGEFLVSITARDIFGHTTFYLLTLYKDTIAPSITINSPVNNTYWNSPPYLNVTAIDPNLDTIWYTAMGTKVILSGVDPFNISIWIGLSEGVFTIEFYANDTFGYNSTSVILTLIKDTTLPQITVNSPENSTYYSDPPSMDIIMSDFNPDTIWYIAMGTKVILSGEETFDLSIWNSLGQGEFQINIFANDTAGNLNDSIILTLYKDTIAPSMTINLPLNNTHLKSNPIFNVGAYDPNSVTIWYQVVGYSPVILSNNTDEYLNIFIWSGLSEGIFFVDVFAEDSLGNINDPIRLTLYKDTVEPEIDIILPQPNDIYGEIAPSFTISVIEDHLNTTWYILIGESTIIQFTGLDGTIRL
jgi:hypothetical protein